MTSMSELSDDDIVVQTLCEKIRQLADEVAAERRLKQEVIARYERTATDKHELETRVALLEAENKGLHALYTASLEGKPVFWREQHPPSQSLVVPGFVRDPTQDGNSGSDYFLGIP